MARAGPADRHDPRWHRLSALDAAFLDVEDENNPINIGATAIFGPGRVLDSQGRIDQATYLAYANDVLARLPKWRLRPARVPLFRHRVLIADSELDLRRHLRFVHLNGGTRTDLDRLASALYSERLDRDHPLWQQLVIDGLADGGFAVITKLHHAMADGVAGFGALAAMLSLSPDTPLGEEDGPVARTPPTRGELFRAELGWRAREPGELIARTRAAVAHPERARAAAKIVVSGLLSAGRMSARPAPKTPLNPRRISPRREYLGVRLDLEAVKRVRRAAGAKLNDVVLATVAGALQRYFAGRGFDLAERELRFMVPVSLHASGSTDVLGNEVSLMLVPVSLDGLAPRERLARIAERSRQVKSADQSGAFAIAEHAAEWIAAPFVPWAIRLVLGMRPYNVIVTNVAGPPMPLYLLDARMREVYPMVPLYRNQALAFAIVSYDGGLYFGLSGEPDHVPDLGNVAAAVRDAFDELQMA